MENFKDKVAHRVEDLEITSSCQSKQTQWEGWHDFFDFFLDLRSHEKRLKQTHAFNATSNSQRALAYQLWDKKMVLLPYLKKLSSSIYIPLAMEAFITQIMSLSVLPHV